MPSPSNESYRRALREARARRGAISEEVARQIIQALNRYAAGIGTGLIRLGTDAEIVRRAEALINGMSNRLLQDLEKAIAGGRAVLFEEVVALYDEAGKEAAMAAGVDAVVLARIRPPVVPLVGAYSNVNAAAHWRTLLRGHVVNAAGEANEIVRLALTEGVSPGELAKRLRAYVVGSEPFQDLFDDVVTPSGVHRRIDLRRIPRELRGQARQMEWNSRRIAFSEFQNARHEAEAQHMLRDPLVAAIRWRLSPNRGPNARTDVCDVLATADWYGMGPGVYPVDKAPAPPHPLDKCEKEAVTRSTADMHKPKPSPRRIISARDVPIPNAGQLTARQERGLRRDARRAIRFGEVALRQATSRA
jgi:hypothetical protein